MFNIWCFQRWMGGLREMWIWTSLLPKRMEQGWSWNSELFCLCRMSKSLLRFIKHCERKLYSNKSSFGTTLTTSLSWVSAIYKRINSGITSEKNETPSIFVLALASKSFRFFFLRFSLNAIWATFINNTIITIFSICTAKYCPRFKYWPTQWGSYDGQG